MTKNIQSLSDSCDLLWDSTIQALTNVAKTRHKRDMENGTDLEAMSAKLQIDHNISKRSVLLVAESFKQFVNLMDKILTVVDSSIKYQTAKENRKIMELNGGQYANYYKVVNFLLIYFIFETFRRYSKKFLDFRKKLIFLF